MSATRRSRFELFDGIGLALAACLLGLLVLPIVALGLRTTPTDLLSGLRHPLFASALRLSLVTTAISLGLVVVGGTPLAWWLARTEGRGARVVETLVQLPIVVPPAAVGIALIAAFGRFGVFGGALTAVGVDLAFTPAAVVVAQVVVSSPFFVQAAANAFRRVEPEALDVARTLGASRWGAFVRVAVPTALPGLFVAVTLAWARALGEFGATILFAGNERGATQTMPLAIYAAMQTDVHLAVVLALALAVMGGALLLVLRLVPPGLERWRR